VTDLRSQIISLLEKGYSQAEISRRLGCASSTVSYHANLWRLGHGGHQPEGPEERRLVDKLVGRIKQLEAALSKRRSDEDLIAEVCAAIESHQPVFSAPKLAKLKGKSCVLVALFSDLHYGEVVSEDETLSVGCYDAEVARRRTHEYAQKISKFIDRTGAREVVVYFLGDIVSGDIHEELSVTNAVPITEQALSAGELMAEFVAAISQKAKVRAFCVVGNHGRLRKRYYYKQKQVLNMDWLAYKFAERLVDGVEFVIPRSPWMISEVLGTKFLLIHGDQVRSWAGIPWYGLTREVLRRRVLGADVGHDFDHLVMGHFHIPAVIPIQQSRCFVNGSLKGGDEYSLGAIASASRPAQLLLEVTEKLGVTSVHEIYLD
jgi:UDP-2,3-diacylglucosamine pyrophosphatase LpxH/transposase-like protein